MLPIRGVSPETVLRSTPRCRRASWVDSAGSLDWREAEAWTCIPMLMLTLLPPCAFFLAPQFPLSKNARKGPSVSISISDDGHSL